MPPRAEITNEKILSAAFSLLREQGMDALTARAVAARLKCSTQPIYSVCGGMDDLRREIYLYALEYAKSFMNQATDPRYNRPLNLGLGYLRLASKEKQLFRAVFLSDWAGKLGDAPQIGRDMLSAHAKDSTRLPRLNLEQQEWLYQRMTEYLTGLGAMISSGALEIADEERAARIVDMYEVLTDTLLRRNGRRGGDE